MLTDYAAANGIEIWNTTRLQSYLTNVGSPFDTGPQICTCPTLTPALIGDDAGYLTPSTGAQAPWYDPDLPVSAEYLGFLPLDVAGIEDNPRSRTVTGAVGGGGVFGPVRASARTMTVTGIIIGSTCCGASYGLHYLAEALSGCTGDVCDGDCLTMYQCCPAEGMTKAQFDAQYRRTFRRTSLVSGPTVTRRRAGGDCRSGNCSGGELIEVEFVLVAATPWAWTDPMPMLEVDVPLADNGTCIDWCVQPGGCPGETCLFAPCPDDTACQDPRNPVPRPPQPTLPDTSFCIPLGAEATCYPIDMSSRPQWTGDVPIIEVRAGSSDMRNVRISFYEKPEGAEDCEAVMDANRCNVVNDFVIAFIPAGSILTIDGQVGRAVLYCGGRCQPAQSVYGNQDGGPIRIQELDCAEYCVCIESDPLFPPAPEATVTLSTSGRGY